MIWRTSTLAHAHLACHCGDTPHPLCGGAREQLRRQRVDLACQGHSPIVAGDSDAGSGSTGDPAEPVDPVHLELRIEPMKCLCHFLILRTR